MRKHRHVCSSKLRSPFVSNVIKGLPLYKYHNYLYSDLKFQDVFVVYVCLSWSFIYFVILHNHRDLGITFTFIFFLNSLNIESIADRTSTLEWLRFNAVISKCSVISRRQSHKPNCFLALSHQYSTQQSFSSNKWHFHVVIQDIVRVNDIFELLHGLVVASPLYSLTIFTKRQIRHRMWFESNCIFELIPCSSYRKFTVFVFS